MFDNDVDNDDGDGNNKELKPNLQIRDWGSVWRSVSHYVGLNHATMQCSDSSANIVQSNLIIYKEARDSDDGNGNGLKMERMYVIQRHIFRSARTS